MQGVKMGPILLIYTKAWEENQLISGREKCLGQEKTLHVNINYMSRIS